MNDGTRNIPVGTWVNVTAHRSGVGQGLSYDGQTVLLQEPCHTYGWDVLDVTDEDGNEMSVYSFSVEDVGHGR